MRESCKICGKRIPEWVDYLPDTAGLTCYSYATDDNGKLLDTTYDFAEVCSKACFIALLEEASEKLPPNARYRICMVFPADNPKEVLASLARQLRAIR